MKPMTEDEAHNMKDFADSKTFFAFHNKPKSYCNYLERQSKRGKISFRLVTD